MSLLPKLITNQTDLSFRFAKHVFDIRGDRNLTLSPLSINILLGMVAAGSTGLTRDTLLTFLKSDSTDDFNAFAFHVVTKILADAGSSGGPNLSAANGAWMEQTLRFKPSYKHLLETSYKAVCESVDFKHKAREVVDHVNSWVEEKTGGLIKKTIDESAVSPLTTLILANALYFKGVWADKFDTSNTTDQDFYLMNGTSVQAPFMTSPKKQYVKAFDGFKVLRLPYQQDKDKERQFSMYIFLPNAMDGLLCLMDKITSESGFIERHTPNYCKVRVGEFRIPKFKITFDFEVLSVLEKLGVKFGGYGQEEMVVNPRESPIVSSIFHKCVVEVNEEGTEAAAVTTMMAFGCSRWIALEEKIDFVADHPFVFFIREDISGAIVFIGKVLNPL